MGCILCARRSWNSVSVHLYSVCYPVHTVCGLEEERLEVELYDGPYEVVLCEDEDVGC